MTDLFRRTDREKQIIAEFRGTEKGTDCTFESLPNAVQEIALKKIAISKDENELVRHLDRCEELRIMTDTPDEAWVKEVDPIVRYYRYRVKR